MEMYEQELYQSELFTTSVTNAILETLRALSGDVFTTVGFMDARAFKTIIYESSDTTNMQRESIFTSELKRLGLFDNYLGYKRSFIREVVLTLPSNHDDLNLALFDERPVSWLHRIRRVAGRPARRHTLHHQSLTQPPGLVPPYYAFADILHRDQSLRLSLSTSFSMDQSIWNPSSGNGSRCRCNIVAKEVEARLDASPSTNTVLEIYEIRLSMGPSPTSQFSRMITAHHQSPSLKDITVSGSTTSYEYGVEIAAGYPQVAKVGATAKQGEAVNRPPTCIGLNLKTLQVGIENGNQLYWKYPVKKSLEYLKKSAKFVDHSGSIMYPSNNPPDTMRVSTSMICGLSHPNVSWSTLFRGLIPSRILVNDGNVLYPCRQVRFCLHTDILPDDDGNFEFPNEGECGFPVDLGQYKFSDDNGYSVLEVQRTERRPLIINNLHTWTPSHTEAVEEGVTTKTQGIIVSTQQRGVSTKRQVETSLEMELRRPQKRLQRPRKSQTE